MLWLWLIGAVVHPSYTQGYTACQLKVLIENLTAAIMNNVLTTKWLPIYGQPILRVRSLK